MRSASHIAMEEILKSWVGALERSGNWGIFRPQEREFH
jgi:hypothetical protein